MRNKLPMTSWYNPVLLVQTGIRVAVSTVFGQFADRREAIAAANAIEPQPIDSSLDYSSRAPDGAFWFDFLADTGDGWDPTFAMARLVTEAQLQPSRAAEPLPRGRLLLLGGDQVYPTASRQAYDDRFLGPFEEAFERASTEAKEDMPDLYAIPGNHDWYDGLNAFFGLFCRRRIAPPGTFGVNRPGRKIAGRATNQTRSYFALKLPENWWIWAMDSQLAGYIDQPQIDYFQYIASSWMKPGSNLILCVGQPDWAYVNEAQPAKKFETFSYLERLAGIAREPLTPEERDQGVDPDSKPLMGHKLRLVLTGDSHHYSRFVEDRADGEPPVHYVTCGGGGAFLHPTHHLADRRFDWDYPPPGDPRPRQPRGYARHFRIADKIGGAAGKALFPDAETSRGLTAGNLSLAKDNPWMTLVFVVAYLIYNWLLNMNARIDGHFSLVDALTAGQWWEAPLRYAWMAFVSPWPIILFLVALGGYYYFADSPDDSGRRLRIGLVHCLVQAGAAILVTSTILAGIGGWLFGDAPIRGIAAGIGYGLLLLGASAVAGLLAATIFGLYLWRELNRSGRHWNEAFSSLAIQDYKSFLRMRIRTDGKLEIFPIGLETVPEGGGTVEADRPDTLRPHLIEGPIVVG